MCNCCAYDRRCLSSFPWLSDDGCWLRAVGCYLLRPSVEDFSESLAEVVVEQFQRFSDIRPSIRPQKKLIINIM
jgi:hypothetical protein